MALVAPLKTPHEVVVVISELSSNGISRVFAVMLQITYTIAMRTDALQAFLAIVYENRCPGLP
jgi:hypothetical protein